MPQPVKILLLVTVAAAFYAHTASAYVELPPLVGWSFSSSPPVTAWLLAPTVTQPLAWRKLGAKIWAFLANLDHDFVKPGTTQRVPSSFPGATRIFGPSVTCGRFARQFIRIPFHDCGTYDVGNTGSFGDTGKPRFGCNGSLRKEMGPCLDPRPQACVNGVEARFDLATGAFLNQHVFESVEARYNATFVDWAQDAVNPRVENFGFGMSMAFFYQLKYETQVQEHPSTRLPKITMADIMTYAGHLATAMCQGPHIEFKPGRPDSDTADDAFRLPPPFFPAWRVLPFAWTNGLTNMDSVILTTSHSLACFAAGCLDSTPSIYDLGWAINVDSVTNISDPRICDIRPDGPRPAPSGQCILNSDAQLNARPDTRAYLQAILGRKTISSVAGAFPPTCTRQTGAPQCTAQVGVWPFSPFKILPVNLCKRDGVTKRGCPQVSGATAQQNDMFATSWIKMTMCYAVNGINQGLAYSVRAQPCQPGTIRVGGTPGQEGISTRCQCCPNPPPQTFGAAITASVPVSEEAGPAPVSADSAAVVTEPDAVTTAAAVTQEEGVSTAAAAATTTAEEPVIDHVAAADVATAAAAATATAEEPVIDHVAAADVATAAAAATATAEEPAIDPVAAAEEIKARAAAWAAFNLGA